MRQYVLDEIRPEDISRVRQWVAERAELSGVEDLYWMNFQTDLLSQTQFQHQECQPHAFAIELGETSVKFEFLVRSRHNYRCRVCQIYATPPQRQFILDFADRLIADLQLLT
ncbi:MAG: hypothetical protein V2A77_07495 [Pseudomonadota bacterium]